MPNERRSQGCYCQKYVDSISRIARLEEDVARLKRENAGLREQLELSDVPKAFRGVPIALVTASLLAMAFMGFSGVDGGLKILFGL